MIPRSGPVILELTQAHELRPSVNQTRHYVFIGVRVNLLIR